MSPNSRSVLPPKVCLDAQALSGKAGRQLIMNEGHRLDHIACANSLSASPTSSNIGPRFHPTSPALRVQPATRCDFDRSEAAA